MARARYETAAFNVDTIRRQMWEGVIVPPALLQRAVNKLSEKLDAKETKLVTLNGRITDSVDLEAHGIQLDAADKILKIADGYARGDAQPPAAAVRLRVDPNTGLFEIIIGGGSDADALANGDVSHATHAQLAAPAEQLALSLPMGDVSQVEAEPQVVKIPRGKLPKEVWDALYGENGDK